MFVLFLLPLLAFLIEGCSAVVYGTESDLKDFPFIVLAMIEQRIIKDGQRFIRTSRCGGTIIGRNTILTAAHCFRDGTEINPPKDLSDIVNIKIYDGNPDWREAQETPWLYGQLMLHEDYDTNTFNNDLAIFWVQYYMDPKSIAPLPTTDPITCTVAKYAGWGITERTSSAFIASEGYGYYKKRCPKDKSICIPSPNDQMAPCTGDSGGPLEEGGKVIGVASFVVTSTNYPPDYSGFEKCIGRRGIFTNVYYFLDWINKYKDLETKPQT